MAGVVNTFVERLVRNRGKEHTRPSLQKRTVLLIGPTGEGKSTVGSFLADPTNHARNPVFQRATSNAPQTSKTESSGVKVLPVMGGMQECEFEFVDTPGLNEGKAQDLEHMVDVFQCLQQKQKISAIVLVYKHDSKISEPLKRLLGFYRRFFGGLLASNFFVILSNFRWDQQSIENRSADSYSLVKVKKQIEMELRDVLEISSSITILDIDARPGSWVPSSSGMQDPSPTEAFSELGQALARRSRVLDKVFTLPLVDVAQLRFAKLPAMVEEDEALKNQLRERVTGYVDNYKRMSKELVIKGTELQVSEDADMICFYGSYAQVRCDSICLPSVCRLLDALVLHVAESARRFPPLAQEC